MIYWRAETDMLVACAGARLNMEKGKGGDRYGKNCRNRASRF